MQTAFTLDPALCYSALQARDARFDGVFFVGVTSTKIYCRPICKVRLPKPENCRFFSHSGVAEGLGFRACLRCRPELAPLPKGIRWSNEDASQTLAHQALALLAQTGHTWAIREIAAKMGISDRHLRRIFATHWGLSPSAYAQHLQAQAAQPLTLKLPFYAPYSRRQMLDFFACRAINGVEHVDTQQRLWRSIRLQTKQTTLTGWICAQFNENAGAQSLPSSTLAVNISPSLARALPTLVPLLRSAFDLDAEPNVIDRLLLADFPSTEGQRIPGCFDGFELAVRAILGQQITVQAARTLTNRLVLQFGEPLKNSTSPLSRLFPTAQTMVQASAQDFANLGIVRSRQAALLALAQAVVNGLDLSYKQRSADDMAATRQALSSIKGIGHWTANYVSMRALHDPDAFPAGDVALQKALGISIEERQASPAKAAKTAEALSKRWHPWRSYAVLRAWGRL